MIPISGDLLLIIIIFVIALAAVIGLAISALITHTIDRLTGGRYS